MGNHRCVSRCISFVILRRDDIIAVILYQKQAQSYNPTARKS